MKAAVAGLRQGGGKTVVFWDDPHAARSDDVPALARAVDRRARWPVPRGRGRRCEPARHGRHRARDRVGDGRRSRRAAVRATRRRSRRSACCTACAPRARPRSGRATSRAGASSCRARATSARPSRACSSTRVHVSIADVDRDKAAAVGVPVLEPDDVARRPSATCSRRARWAECSRVESVARVAVPRSSAAPRTTSSLDDAAADALEERGIVYAPDYVVNVGGIINLAQEWAPGGYSRERRVRGRGTHRGHDAPGDRARSRRRHHDRAGRRRPRPAPDRGRGRPRPTAPASRP